MPTTPLILYLPGENPGQCPKTKIVCKHCRKCCKRPPRHVYCSDECRRASQSRKRKLRTLKARSTD